MQATMPTLEYLLQTLTDMATARAGLAGVGRVNQNNGHPGDVGLVGEKLPQLIERPAMVLSSLRFPHPGPLPNAGQVLKSNRRLSRFGFLDNLLRDAVIDAFSKSSFLAADPPEQLATAFGAFALNARANPEVVIPNSGSAAALPRLTRTGMGNIAPTQVNANYFWRLTRWLSRYLNLNLKVVVPVAAFNQYRAGWTLPLQQAQLVIANIQRQPDSTADQGNADRLSRLSIAKRSHVQGQASRSKLMPLFSTLQRRDDSADCLTDVIGLQPSGQPYVVVGQVMQPGRVFDLMGLSNAQDLIASCRKFLQSTVNCWPQLGRDLKLTSYRYSLTHSSIIFHPQDCGTPRPAFLSPLSRLAIAGVSSGLFR